MSQKESWGAMVATKEAHSTQMGQPRRMHGPGWWRYEQNEQRVTPVPMIGVNCDFWCPGWDGKDLEVGRSKTQDTPTDHGTNMEYDPLLEGQPVYDLTDLSVHPPTISDHGLIIASIPFLCEMPSYFLRQVRDWRSFDREAFRLALLESPAIADPSALEGLPVADTFTIYETTMVDLLNRFLPTRQARVRRNQLSPWFDAECRSLRRGTRRLERRYRKSKLQMDRIAWIKSVRDMHKRYRGKERDYWLKLQRMLTNRSGYGPPSTPYLVGGELTAVVEQYGTLTRK